MNKIFSLIFCVILTFTSLNAQRKQIREGDALFNQLAYSKAIPVYIKSLKKDSSRNTMLKIANSYFLNNDYVEAEKWYRSSFKDQQYVYQNGKKYAQVLKNLGEYEQLEEFVNNFDFDEKDDFNNYKNIKDLSKIESKYIIKPVSFNTEKSEFASFIFNDKLYVSQEKENRNANNNYSWTNKGYYDIYTANSPKFGVFENLEFVEGKVNTDLHEGASCYDKVNSVIYFTRNNTIQKRPKKNKEGYVNLKLFSAEVESESLNNIKPFDFNNDNYSLGQPSVSPNGQYLYLISDIDGGFGGTDIYVCEREGDRWGNPVNLGPTINTKFDEMFPTVYSENEIYFSSEGHNTLGGLDIFKSKKDDSNWQQPVNLGTGINSPADDFSLIFANEEKNKGYFSSNRSSGKGGDDVYSFIKTNIEEEDVDPNLIPYKVTVYDEENGQAIEGVNVDLFLMPDNEMLSTNLTNEFGEAIFMVDPNKEYRAQINKGGYFNRNENELNTQQDAVLGLYQNELNKSIRINNIYYNLDKWDILPASAIELDKIVKILKDNTNVNIELSSHTDSRGSDLYNENLSAKRAQSAAAYIVSNGINSFRIKAVGYGERYISNRCFNDIICSDNEHLQNRRTEFKVTGYGNGDIISQQNAAIQNSQNDYNAQPVNDNYVNNQNINNSQNNISSLNQTTLSTFYSIQIGAFSKSSLQKMQYLNSYGRINELKENNIFIYTLGQFSSIEEANTVLQKLKMSNEAKGAFVVKVENNKRFRL